MAPSVAPVLVVGGGPSGLAAALTLLQNCVPVRIIDKEPQYRIGQRACGIWPRTFEAFHLLRVCEAHQKARPVIPTQEYKPGTLEPTKTFLITPHSDPTPSIPYSNLMFLGQPILEGVLRSNIEKYGCSVELGTELESFEDDGERVLAKLVKKVDGRGVIEIFEASYLVGADGAKGVTRKLLGLTFFGETRTDLACVIADVCLEAKGIDRDHWHMFGDRTADFCTLRPTDEIAPDGFQCIVILKDYDPKQLIADPTLMFKGMSKLIGQEISVRKVVALSDFRPNIRMIDTFGRGRVFLAGDAAHVHSPTGGQGLNTSVQDALNLAWKLSLVHRGFSSATLLDSYTTERLPVIAEMLDITTGILNKILESPTMEGAMGREKYLNMLGVNYRAGPIVLDEFADTRPVSAYRALDEGELVAGDRAPDAPGLIVVTNGVKTKTETRLFDVFSATHHTVLVFTPDASSTTGILEVLKKYSGDVIQPVVILPEGLEEKVVDQEKAVGQVNAVIDKDGHAYRSYLAVKGEQRVVIVRPDGVVGAIVHGAEGMTTYFEKIFRLDV